MGRDIGKSYFGLLRLALWPPAIWASVGMLFDWWLIGKLACGAEKIWKSEICFVNLDARGRL